MTEPKVKRVYEAPEETDGTRVLVDRLWPRGVSREKGRIDHWLKDVSPSNDLRKRYAHRDEAWDEFREAYFAELDGAAEAVHELRDLMAGGPVTLLYAARSPRNNAVALLEYLRERG